MVLPVLYSNTSLPSTMQSGLDAYQGASKGIQQSAAELSGGLNARQYGANASQSNHVNINSSTINLLSNELQAKAATEVIKTADGMLGTIIDTFA